MKFDNLFKGDNNTLKTITNIFGAIGNIGASKTSDSSRSSNRLASRLCNSKIISMDDAYIKILSGNLLILDVRTQNEYSIIRIKGAVNIPLDKLELNMVKFESNKDREMLVYCATGSRAKLAVQNLYKLGYKNVFVWDGAGINNFKYQDIIEKNTNISDSNRIM